MKQACATTTTTNPVGLTWEASIRNKLALALHALGRHAESRPHFERALAMRKASGSPRSVYGARWLAGSAMR